MRKPIRTLTKLRTEIHLHDQIALTLFIHIVNGYLFSECTHLLLAHGAPVKVKNLEGWSPLAEAISYGDRQTSKCHYCPNRADQCHCNVMLSVCSLLHKLKSQAREQMEQRRPNLVKALKQMGDFYMELKWDFQSWGIYILIVPPPLQNII